MKRKSSIKHSIEYILTLMSSNNVKAVIEGETVRLKGRSHRLSTFKQSQRCYYCGMIASYFVLESNNPPSYHLNMYGVEDNGEEVLFVHHNLEDQDIHVTSCMKCHNLLNTPPQNAVGTPRKGVASFSQSEDNMEKIGKVQSTVNNNLFNPEMENRHRILLGHRVPYVMRLDGVGFSNWTNQINWKNTQEQNQRFFTKNFDNTILWALTKACEPVMEHFSLHLGYVGSDEVSLVFLPRKNKKTGKKFIPLMYSGNVQKTISIATSIFTARFNELIQISVENNYKKSLGGSPTNAYFDCRIFPLEANYNYEDDNVLSNQFMEEIWKYLCYRRGSVMSNALASFGRGYYSAKQMHGLSMPELYHKLLDEKAVRYEDEVAEWFRCGSLVCRSSYDVNIYGEIEKFEGASSSSFRIIDFDRNEGALMREFVEKVLKDVFDK